MAILEDIESALPVPVVVDRNTQLFKFEGHDITTISDDKGNPWWIAKEVCDVLGISNPTMALKSLDKDEVTKLNLGGLKGEVNIINEPGLYSLILRSRKPAAKIFKRWVTHEVLPAIRKTGCYTAKPSAPELPAPISPRDQLILATVDNYLMKGMNACNEEFIDKVRKLTDKVNKLSIENATLKEKADSYDRVFSGRSGFCIRDAARMLGLPMHSLFTFLRNKKYIDKDDLAYSKWVQKGFFIIRTNAKHPLKIVPQQTLITPAGLKYFSDIVAKGKFDLIEKF
ncbi:phage antirepressor protein [Desulfosarcina variabilis str. Montpellier]